MDETDTGELREASGWLAGAGISGVGGRLSVRLQSLLAAESGSTPGHTASVSVSVLQATGSLHIGAF